MWRCGCDGPIKRARFNKPKMVMVIAVLVMKNIENMVLHPKMTSEEDSRIRVNPLFGYPFSMQNRHKELQNVKNNGFVN